MKHSNLYFGLVLPSGGWQSLIGWQVSFYAVSTKLLFFDQKTRHQKLFET